ncbi:MAG: flagellar biosynthesis protein FlgF [Rhizobiales bacterium]|nr:flagellar biosynthesis protein FlgF [Hyphomicrobiales bacterium]MBA67564.1 flagellar biosynthesis protein FlgF [Hyphomicrobiales bacterium]
MTTTYTNYQLISRDIDRSIERISQQPQVQRETEYYLSRIGDIKSIDDFMADDRIYNYAMKAFGLEDMSYAKAFMRKVLTEGIDNDNAFANQLADGKYKAFAEAFNFNRYGETATVFTRAQQGAVDMYLRQTLEEEAGSDDTGVRLALFFERNASDITSAYSILADEALYQVVRTVLGLSDAFAAGDIDKQADYLKEKLDFADFSDPEKLDEFLQRFTIMWDLENNSAAGIGGSNLLLSSSSGFDISPDLMLTINNLKLGGR